MDKLTSLKAAKECIDAAICNVKNNNKEKINIAIHNAIECLKSVEKEFR